MNPIPSLRGEVRRLDRSECTHPAAVGVARSVARDEAARCSSVPLLRADRRGMMRLVQHSQSTSRQPSKNNSSESVDPRDVQTRYTTHSDVSVGRFEVELRLIKRASSDADDLVQLFFLCYKSLVRACHGRSRLSLTDQTCRGVRERDRTNQAGFRHPFASRRRGTSRARSGCISTGKAGRTR